MVFAASLEPLSTWELHTLFRVTKKTSVNFEHFVNVLLVGESLVSITKLKRQSNALFSFGTRGTSYISGKVRLLSDLQWGNDGGE